MRVSFQRQRGLRRLGYHTVLLLAFLTPAAILTSPQDVGIDVVKAVSQEHQNHPPRWQAKWIWQASSRWLVFNPEKQTLEFKPILPEEKNTHLYFRKTFDLPGRAQTAPAYVCADSRYKLYVNGQFVGRGPVRSYPQFQYYDVYDLAKYLQPGRNVVAAVVHFYGETTAWYVPARGGVIGFGSGRKAVPGKGGFLFQCDVRTSDGRQLTIATDETWKIKTADAWKQDTPRVNFSLGFIEVYDARKEPLGWSGLDFDDTDWGNALAYWSWTTPVPPTEPFTNMLPRDIPFLLEKPVSAERIIEVGEVLDALGDVPADQMAREELVPLSDAACQNPENVLVPDGQYAVIQAPAGKSVSLVLDFGRTVTGYSRLEVEGSADAIIDIGVSERLNRTKERYLGWSKARPMPAKKTGVFLTVEHGKQADRYITRAGKQVWEAQEIRGFRYLQVTFRNVVQPLKVDAISLTFTSYPVESRGRFECSNHRLNQIWRTGAYTLQMCMTDAYVDCPSREQRQWVGDAYVEAMVNYAAFGDPRLTAKLVRQTAQSQQIDGMTMAYAPGDHDVLSIVLADFCLHWIMTIYEYYMYTGDADLVRQLYPHVRLAIGWFERYLNQDGLLERVPHWTFIDWADVDKRGAVTALNALFYKALRDAAVMASLSGIPDDRARFEKLAERMKNGMNESMWDAERGVYVDCFLDGKPCRRVSQQSNAVVILFGIAPENRWPRIIDYITDPKRVKLRQSDMSGLLTPGRFDEETDVILAQPFFSFYLHRALAKAGVFDKAVARIEELWGALLDAGATTWWEEWEQRIDSSECHAWSAAPTFDLSTEVLGVRPTEPGFARLAVEPKITGLSYARGVFPTVKGDISVDWKLAEGRFLLIVQSPEPTKIDLALPVEKSARVRVNDAVVWDGAQFRKNSVGVVNAQWSGKAIQLEMMRGGTYRVEALLP